MTNAESLAGGGLFGEGDGRALAQQLNLFEAREAGLDQDAPNKPGAVWNGRIWASDDDVPF